MTRRRILSVVAGIILAFLSAQPSFADTEIVAIPTAWRLQNYIGNQGLTAWFTGSTCTNGLLSFSATSTLDDRNRFFSLVLSAKISSKTISVFYETTSGYCQITSFYIQ